MLTNAMNRAASITDISLAIAIYSVPTGDRRWDQPPTTALPVSVWSGVRLALNFSPISLILVVVARPNVALEIRRRTGTELLGVLQDERLGIGGPIPDSRGGDRIFFLVR